MMVFYRAEEVNSQLGAVWAIAIPPHVGGISDNLILDFLPSLQTLLDQDLRAQTERLGAQVPQLFFVVGETGSKTS